MACVCTIRKAVGLGLVLLAAALALPAAAPADQIGGSVEVKIEDGYARLVFTIGDEVDASVRLTGGVLVVSFTKPVFVSVERLVAQAPDYISAARRDPDGKSIRMALARKLTVNATGAAERFFVDLMPESWNGPPPSLPAAVIEDLAHRAREADRLQRLQRKPMPQAKIEPALVRVRVAHQPTFMRYVFDLPDRTNVGVDRAKERLTLTFDTPIAFDLADALAALPPAIAAINAEAEDSSSLLRFTFQAKIDLRTFQDGKSYVVDIMGADTKPAETGPAVENQTAPQEASAEPAPAEKPASENTPSSLPDAIAATMEKRGVAAPGTVPALGAPGSVAAAPPAETRPVAANSATRIPPASEAAPAAPAPKTVAPPVEAAKIETPAAKPAKAESPKAEPLKVEPPKPEPSKVDQPQADPPKAQLAKVDPPKVEQSNLAPPKADPPDAQQTKVEPEKVEQPSLAPPKADPPAMTTQPAAPPPPVAAAPDRAAAAPSAPRQGETAGKVVVEMSRQGANLTLSFPFLAPTAAAVFQRADSLWLVFDAKAAIELSALDGEASRTIRDAEFTRAPDADIVRIRLDRPHLASVATEGPAWTVTIGDSVPDPTHALEIERNMIGPNRSSVTIPFLEPHQLHRIDDADVGDQLFVVTAFAPARGFVNEQDFVEFRALGSTQGVVVEPLADDVNVELAPDKVVISRPGGLTLSSSLQRVLRGGGLRPVTFDSQLWGLDQQSTYTERQDSLIAAAAAAPASKRLPSRLDLARFYIARGMYPEAKGVLDVALTEQHPAGEQVSANVLRAVAEVMMNRPDDALRDLAGPSVGDQHDAPLWRAIAYAQQGKWAQARDRFKTVEASIATLPIELQRVALKDEMRAAVEVGDFGSAADELNDFETIGVPHEMQPGLSVLVGRMAEGMGHSEDALTAYRAAADSRDRPAAAQGRLRETALRYALGDLKRQDVITELESLTTMWRGDETEIEALKILARLYTDEGRYRDAFYVMRSAMSVHPNWDMTRRIQEEAAATFEALFLSGKGDSLPPIEALALFYDFRELTPAGRRGDEMIRRLADRLVAVDLLDQAAELLQYQVDHRLQGAARSQVATRLAVIYLMNHKADRALATLQASRAAEVATEVRNQRLLLEARALSEIGRHDIALEVVTHVYGREAIRLRSDILWAARRWREAAEQIELLYGDRWKDWQPLTEVERSDILRAAIGYALGEDALGLSRFRERYAAKMAQTPDARAFEVASAPVGTAGTEFRDIARAAAAVDTLENFLRDMQVHYPDASAMPPPPKSAGALPAAVPAPANAGQTTSAAPAAPAAPPAPASRPSAAAPPEKPQRTSDRTAQR
jgi:tetratricopeptide (TPR) repeat protein